MTKTIRFLASGAIAVLLLLLVVVVVLAAEGDGQTYTATPSVATADVGDTVVVDITLDDTQSEDFDGWTIIFRYNSAVLEVDSVWANESVLPAGLPATIDTSTLGEVGISDAAFITNSGSSQYDMATITFTVKGMGVSNFWFYTHTTPSNGTYVGDSVSGNDWIPALVIANQVTVKPKVQFSDPTYSVDENVGTGKATVTVTLNTTSTQQVTVQYAATGGTATGSGGDYTLVGSTLTFAPGDTTKTFDVTINDDALDENNETVELTLSNAVNANIVGPNPATLTIVDNDPTPSLSINDRSVTEGDASTTNMVFDVTLSAQSGRTVTVDYATQNDTAVAPDDYTAIGTTQLTFAPGDTTKQVTVTVNGDTMDEYDETFFVNLSNPSHATISDDQGVGTITNDDTPSAQVSINDVGVTEGDVGTTNADFTVSLSVLSGKPITVSYNTADNTANAPDDYTSITAGTLVIPAETGSGQITVQVQGDVLDEDNETFFVNLTGAQNAAGIADNQGVGTINDNDPLPSLSIDDRSVTEGTGGTTDMVFTVTLAPQSGRHVTVTYATANNTAVAPGDYAAIGATQLTFAPGETTRQITVTIQSDALDENDTETFFVNLSGAVNAIIGNPQGEGTITDDDDLPSLSIDDRSVTEGTGGTTDMVFTVTLAPQSGRHVTVTYATANNTAVAPGDYAAIGATQLTFAPGETTRQITVTIQSDALDENDTETFFVNLSGAVNAIIGNPQGEGTITDDDDLPSLSIDDRSVTEGTGGTTDMVFTVTLAPQSGRHVTVTYATANNTAVAPDDYAAIGATQLVFAPGETTKQVTVTIQSDALDEDDTETFFVNLSNAVHAIIGDNQGIGTITDDDDLPSLSINDQSVTEGTGGTTDMVFTVTLAPQSGRHVTVTYATANNTAVAPDDYAAIGATQLVFAPGETSKQVTVTIQSDALDEDDTETFFVNLSNAVHAIIGDNQGIGTITDDDDLPSLSINDQSVTEGTGGTTDMVFTVTLAPQSGRHVTVTYATANNTAVAPDDYAAIGATQLVFAPGETTRQVTVQVQGDTLDEDNETFFVNLSGAQNANISDSQGVGTIEDNDVMPTVDFDSATYSVGEGDGTTTITVTLSAPSGRQVTVDYATSDDTAMQPGDYVAISGTLTFNPGDTSETFNVTINDDTLDEDDETVTLTLSGASNATTGPNNPATLIIVDNDVPVVDFSSGTYNVNEGAGTATVNVTLDIPSWQAVTVNYATSNGTAVAPGDYTAASGTLTFNPGITSQTFDVTINDDALPETNETVTLDLSNASNATTGPNDPATLTIFDNDVTLVDFSSATYNVNENDGTATINVTLDAVSALQVTVNYATSNGTAVAPGDYTAASGTLTFNPGITSRTFDVTINDDALDENNETVMLALSSPSNANIGPNDPATLTIVDNDAPPTVDFSSATYSVSEGGGTATINVTLNAASGKTVTVDYATSNGTAVAPGDYTAASGTLTFNPGVTSRTFDVTINDDALDENDETVTLALSSPSNATVGTNDPATLTIVDNDAPPTVDFSSATYSVDEGAGTATITVTLDAASGKTVTVNYATSNGTAVAPGDYTAASGTLTFNPGITSQTFDVTINNDALDEDAETVTLTLSGASNATLGAANNPATLTIVDNDDPPTVDFDSATYSVDEGAGTATIAVTLDAASGKTVTVDYATSDGTAQEPGDYTAASGTLTFSPGVTGQTFDVTINEDALPETNETVVLDLLNANNANIGPNDPATLTIFDNDTSRVDFDNTTYSVNEGDGTATITVTLDAASALQVTVDYATGDGTAEAPGDYTASSGTLTFAPGDTSETFTVSIVDDTLDEPDETVTLDLSNASNANIGPNDPATLTIVDNNAMPTVDFSSATYSVDEGDGTATITVTLDAASGRTVTVDYATSDGTATQPDDYTAISGTLTFSPGVTGQTLNVPINDDTQDEPDETVTLSLSNVSNATIGANNPVTLTIGDNDPNAVAYFVFDPIADQVAGTAFVVTITAYDAYSSIVPFSGTVALTDTTSTIWPIISGDFSAGVWSGPVTIGMAATDVVITATDGLASGVSNPFTVTNPAPFLTSLSPISATAGGPAFTLTVNGTNFVAGSTVHWNGTPRTTTFVNDTQLLADITALDIATVGTASVTVVNPAPGGGTSNALPFEIVEFGPAPPSDFIYLPLVSRNATP